MTNISCPGCGKSYSFDSSKITNNKSLDIPCPNCKSMISFNPTLCEQPENLSDAAILFKKIIKTSKALPPMPEIMAKATAILSDDNAGYREVADVLETDQAMATRVLKIANSAYYGLSVPVESVKQASALLGFETLMELVTVASTAQMMGKSLQSYDISSQKMWEHSLSVATSAKIIAGKQHQGLVGNAFNAGLIHDSGMIILDEYIVKKKEAFQKHISNGDSFDTAEKKILGFNHSEIASEFFKKWQLPPAQTKAIKYHHHPDLSGDDPLSCILHIADYISMLDNPESNYRVNNDILKKFSIGDEEIEQISNETKTAVSSIIQSING